MNPFFSGNSNPGQQTIENNYVDMNSNNMNGNRKGSGGVVHQRPFSAVYTQGITSNIDAIDIQVRSPQHFSGYNDGRHQSAKARPVRPLSSTASQKIFSDSMRTQQIPTGSQSTKNLTSSASPLLFFGSPAEPNNNQNTNSGNFNNINIVNNNNNPNNASGNNNEGMAPAGGSLASFLRPPSANEIKRTVPKNIKKDKEKLWEENLQIKYLWSSVQKENVELKTKNMTLTRENQKLQKLIGDVETYLQQKTGNSGTRENLLIVNLKKQVQDLKQSLTQANSEIQKYKRDYKLNNLKELQVELEITKEECIRLKTLFDQSIRDYAELFSVRDLNDQDKYMQMQFFMVNKIKQENEEQKKNYEEQEKAILDKESQKAVLHKNLMEANKKLEQREEKLTALSEKVASQTSEIQRLTSENTELEKKSHKISEEDKKLMQATQKIKMLETKLSEKEDELKKSQKSSIKALKDASEKLNSEIKDKKGLQDQINKLNEQIDGLKEKMTSQMEERNRIHIQQQLHSNSAAVTLTNIMNTNALHNERIHGFREANLSQNEMPNNAFGQKQQIMMQQQQQQQQQFQSQMHMYGEPGFKRVSTDKQSNVLKQIPVVKREEVEKIGKELNLRCSLRYRNLDEVVKEFLSKIDPQANAITIEETIQNLLESPFNIESKDVALLVARYLIENNTSDKVDFHMGLSTKIQVFKSTLRNLIKELRYFEEDESKRLHEDLLKIVGQFFLTLKQTLELDARVKETQCFTIEQLEKANTQMDPQLTKDQRDYFILKLFERSQTVEFKLEDVYDLFSRKNETNNKNQNLKFNRKQTKKGNKDSLDNYYS